MTKYFILVVLVHAQSLVIAQDCNLPNEIRSVLALEKPISELVDKSDLVPNWNDFLDTSCPTIASGDFNGDDVTDYAILITDNPYELVVAQSNKGSFEVYSLNKIGFGIYDGGLGWGIETWKKSVSIDSIKLKNDGIYFEKFESSSSVYYWDQNQFKKIWLSD